MLLSQISIVGSTIYIFKIPVNRSQKFSDK
jgi:hypothetical protein